MNFAFTEEQNELRRAARRFLSTASSSEKVRLAMASESKVDDGVWSSMATELGWLGLTIPESYEGFGLGPVDQLPLLEEMGRHLLCAPFFSTVCLGVNFLNAAGSEEQKREYLPLIARGELTVTLALTEADGRWEASGIGATATPVGSDYLLHGRKRYVLDGHTADLLLVAVRAEHSSGAEGISVFAVPNAAKGLDRKLLPTLDQTRKQAEIVLDGVRVPASACIGGPGSAWPSLKRTLDLAAAALAAEQVGGAEACLEMAVAYAKLRRQFGRPIGSFQAIKHICAGMLVKVEAARSAAYYAAAVAEAGTDDLRVAASLAKSYCSEAFFHCASENIQVHGGIGFTWEHDAHLFFKRAKSSESLLGDADHHRELLADCLGL
jgi:alkylation response protein AidB-like acyl-CoA dehydrogenase